MPTPNRGKLAGLLTEQPEETQNLASQRPPTWETHIVIPLVQNVAGGIAVFALCWTVTVGLGQYFLWAVLLKELSFWSAVIGGTVTATMTIIRFFGDELGLLTAAYRLGKRSADAQINALTAENEQLRATAREMSGIPTNHRAQEMLERLERAQSDAEHLLALAYGGQSIAREQVKAYLPQRSWERAIQLLRSAGCFDSSGALSEPNLALALGRLRSYADTDRQRADSASWRPAWYVKARH
jgi:hypothetical protein